MLDKGARHPDPNRCAITHDLSESSSVLSAWRIPLYNPHATRLVYPAYKRSAATRRRLRHRDRNGACNDQLMEAPCNTLGFAVAAPSFQLRHLAYMTGLSLRMAEARERPPGSWRPVPWLAAWKRARTRAGKTPRAIQIFLLPAPTVSFKA